MTETPMWMDYANCRGPVDPAIFFPEKGGSLREAKAVCATCPVKQECLDYALSNNERFGFWGGLSERARRQLRPSLRKRHLICEVCGATFFQVASGNLRKTCSPECLKVIHRKAQNAYYARRTASNARDRMLRDRKAG